MQAESGIASVTGTPDAPGRIGVSATDVDPALTNEHCSFWHFRFDAHADMRLAALIEVLREDRQVRRLYLIGQDYSFGQQVAKRAREMIAARRADIQIVGDELHPMGRVKDFMPYAAKIKASGAQAVLTGNWGNDLTLLVRALREVGCDAQLYTFYGNALGAPAAIGEAGIGRVLAVAEWHPNQGGVASEAFYAAFRQRFPDPRDDYLHLRMQGLVQMLAAAIGRAGSTEATAVARALEGAVLDGRQSAAGQTATMRAGGADRDGRGACRRAVAAGMVGIDDARRRGCAVQAGGGADLRTTGYGDRGQNRRGKRKADAQQRPAQ